MSKIDLNTISKLEELAMLRLEEQEKEELLADLNKIVGMVDKLQSIDTTGVKPLKHINDHDQVLREDVIKPSLDRTQVLANSNHSEGHFFSVPKVIK